MNLAIVRASAIKRTPFNPTGRTDARRIKDLAASVTEIGIQVPLLVTRDMRLVDGNRRLACAEALGLEQVPVVFTDQDPMRVYGDVNSTNRKMTSSESLHVYIKEPDAVYSKSRAKFDAMSLVVGPERVALLAKKGKSYQTYAQALKIAAYCDMADDEEFICEALDWLVASNSTYMARTAMEDEVDPEMLRTCVRSDKSLRRDWSAS